MSWHVSRWKGLHQEQTVGMCSIWEVIFLMPLFFSSYSGKALVSHHSMKQCTRQTWKFWLGMGTRVALRT